jgi:NADH-quinone oxidoreductase subunit N
MIEQLIAVFPMAIIVIGAFVMMLLSQMSRLSLYRLNIIAVAFLALSFIVQFPRFGEGEVIYALEPIFGKTFIIDDFSILFDLMFTAGAMLTLLINTDYFRSRRYYNGEYFALILFSVFGMMTLAHANELVTAFIALETASLSVYALVGYHKNKSVSYEAMMKYMILGGLTGAFFILGAALVYGGVGSTHLSDIAAFINTHQGNELTLVIVGGTFMMVTIMFKIGAVPFHSWVVDVYHGAPYPVTMFMASTFKIALFAIALRLYLIDFARINDVWINMLQIITILTLLGGSWLAISQQNIKRMLAGSSVVHSGYLLIGLSSIGLGSEVSAPAIMFYLIAYFFSAAGAFGVLSFISSERQGLYTYEDFKGFADRRPYLALMMAIFMLSLSGFPSTIGFLGKFYIFTGAIESGQILLAGLGIITAFISVYYYFKLIAMMYFYPSTESEEALRFDLSTSLVALMALLIVIGGIGSSLFGFLPGADSFIDVAKEAISSLYLESN